MKKLLLVLLFPTVALAHTQAPGHVKHHIVYSEVNTYEFTVVNRNSYPTGFNVLTYDYDKKTGKMSNEKKLGQIKNMVHNEAVKFSVDFRVAPGQKVDRVMCTEMDAPKSYRSKVCSLIEMERR